VSAPAASLGWISGTGGDVPPSSATGEDDGDGEGDGDGDGDGGGDPPDVPTPLVPIDVCSGCTPYIDGGAWLLGGLGEVATLSGWSGWAVAGCERPRGQQSVGQVAQVSEPLHAWSPQ
jgi:hypothetical protein